MEKKIRQTIRGRVTSDSMNKTRVIEIKRLIKHPLYHKNITRKFRFFVHDEKNESRKGDLIEAVATRPLSKLKNFRLLSIVEKVAT